MSNGQAEIIIGLLESINEKLKHIIVSDGSICVNVVNKVEVEGTVRTREAYD